MKPIRFAWRCLVGHDYLPPTTRVVTGMWRTRWFCQRCGHVRIKLKRVGTQ